MEAAAVVHNTVAHACLLVAHMLHLGHTIHATAKNSLVPYVCLASSILQNTTAAVENAGSSEVDLEQIDRRAKVDRGTASDCVATVPFLVPRSEFAIEYNPSYVDR